MTEPLDAFDKIFNQVQSDFNSDGIETSGSIVFSYIKGLNIHVLATVAVMLLYGIDGLDITHINSIDLNETMKRIDYDEFEPYIMYIMSNRKAKTKPKQVKKAREYADFQTMFVRYIYVLKELNVQMR